MICTYQNRINILMKRTTGVLVFLYLRIEKCEAFFSFLKLIQIKCAEEEILKLDMPSFRTLNCLNSFNNSGCSKHNYSKYERSVI